MQSLKNYLLSVVAVCLIAAIASAMLKNQLLSKVLRLVSGILILLVVISPLLNLDLEAVSSKIQQTLLTDSDQLDDVQKRSKQELAKQIQTATEDHIEQIAAQLGMLVQAKVTVDDAQIPSPIKVELIGTLEPKQISTLSDYIAQNIGIAKENQTWRSYEADS